MPSKKSYLLTGATGFIGSCLLRRLVNDGEDVHIIVRKTAKFWRINELKNKITCHISDLSELGPLKRIIEKIKPKVIYNLAAYGAYSYQAEPDQIIKTNILGTWNLLKAVSRIDYDLFVNTGSSSEYGFKQFAMRETDSLEPASYYAVTKCSQTLLCSHIAREEKKPIVTVRPFSVYGPFEEPTRFIPTLLRSLYSKETMKLVSPEISRDFIYIEDVINAYLSIERLKRHGGEIINIGTGVQSSVKDVVEAAVRATGETTEFKWKSMKQRTWDTTHWVADISRARQLLGWSPKIDLEKGLALTYEWFKNNHLIYGK